MGRIGSSASNSKCHGFVKCALGWNQHCCVFLMHKAGRFLASSSGRQAKQAPEETPLAVHLPWEWGAVGPVPARLCGSCVWLLGWYECEAEGNGGVSSHMSQGASSQTGQAGAHGAWNKCLTVGTGLLQIHLAGLGRFVDTAFLTGVSLCKTTDERGFLFCVWVHQLCVGLVRFQSAALESSEAKTLLI